MTLDELQAQWAEHDRKLDTCLRLNRELLRGVKLSKARTEIQVQATWLFVEAALGLVLVAAIGVFLARHVGAPRLALTAVVLDVYAIGFLIGTVRQLVAALGVDYDRPITAIQKQLEALSILRVRTTQWVLILAPLVWLPALIVGLVAVSGRDPYSFLNTPWVLGNIAFGLAVIAAALWISRRYAERMSRSPFVQRLMRDLTGHRIAAASAFVAKLSEFESDTGSPA